MGDNRMQPGGERRSGQPSGRREVEMPDFDWEDIDWLEETPPDDGPKIPGEPEEGLWEDDRLWEQPSPQQRAPQQRAPQQRVPQQQAPQQRAPQQRAPQQRAPQQRAPQQRAPQQRAPQQRPPQQYAPQQRAPQQQAYRQPGPRQRRPVREDAWQEERYENRAVAVEPDDYRPRRRSGRKQSVPLIILVVILVGGILFAGGKLGSILLNYHRDRSAYNNLADEALAGLAEPDVTSSPDATPDPGETEPQSEVPISADWDLLKSVNADIVGWLYCPNTAINYPVMQTTDNDYYLHRSYDRQPNTAGALFADYNAALGIPLSNFIIYGHNMKDGSMFATVEDYVTQEFYNQHPVMYLLTPTQNYRIELIAAHITEATLDNYPGYFEGDGGYQNYLNLITSSSFFRTNAAVSTQYQLITMSTCDYSSNYVEPRFLLHGQLVPVQ